MGGGEGGNRALAVGSDIIRNTAIAEHIPTYIPRGRDGEGGRGERGEGGRERGGREGGEERE